MKEKYETFRKKLGKHIDLLIQRYPVLELCRQDIIDGYLVMEEAYENNHKLLIAGNGGSAADSEHIAGELMKRFKTPRKVSAEFAKKLCEVDSERGPSLAENLECGLMAIPLVAHEALTTAYINDVDGLGVFAQQLFGYGREGDVFLGISTSGNSKNIISATVVARALGIKIVGLTGQRWRTCKCFGCGSKSSRDRNLYDSRTAFASIPLLVLDVGGTFFWIVMFVIKKGSSTK